MKLHNLIIQSYQTFQEQSQNAQVILLHPLSRYRSVLLAKLVNDPQIRTFYYALGPDDISLRTFIESITHDMANQHPTFGRHLNMLPHSIYEDFDQHVDLVLETFVNEISELSDSDFFLILDEYDRSDSADDIHRFVERLADKLPANCKLIINSRTLPRLPWVAMIAKKQAVMLLDNELIERDFYHNEKGNDYSLEVFALGPGYVLLNNTPVDAWEGHLPRLLFFFALDRPIVTRSEICQAFWPDLEPDQAVNVFHVTKRRLHKALNLDALVHNESHYQVNPELTVYYDVLDFVETLMIGRNPASPNRLEAWQRAAKLYRGPFLQGHNEAWINDRRTAFRTAYLEALSEMAQTWISRDRKELALKLYRQALDEDQTQEPFHQDIMRLYNDLGRRSEAVSHFQSLEKSFREQDLPVSHATKAVYEEIMARG